MIGGARRELQVLLDPVKLASRNLSAAGLIPMLQQANRQLRAGAQNVPFSHVVAAQVLLRQGDRREAASELREYLKSGDAAHRAEVQKSLAQVEAR